MVLIGGCFSPFVRRVDATMRHYGVACEHRALRAVGPEQDKTRKTNPLGRVPALILDDGDVLSDNALTFAPWHVSESVDRKGLATPGAGLRDPRPT